MIQSIPIEHHPLEPFLPKNAKVLFLGSFPPPKHRWCMEFFYPNWINDHWRLEGEVWFADRNYFADNSRKCFKLEQIKEFLGSKGIAFYDTAKAVRRLKDNASDAFLEVVEPTDINTLLKQIPECKAIVTTGEKATQTICRYYGTDTIPKVNTYITLTQPSELLGHEVILYRLPSSSRAFPLSFDKKAEAYRQMFDFIYGPIR